jgi:hypothetical protein
LWNKFVVSHFSDIKQNATYSLSDTETCSKFAEKIITNETKSEDFIVKVIPPRVNERLAFQKGFFLFNCNANKSFECSLCKTFKFPFDNLDYKHAFQFNSNEFLKEISTRNKTKDLSQNPLGHQAIAPLIRVKLSKKYQIQALTDLDNMNINHASLFPGIEGFAKSMKLNMLTTIKENIAFQYSTKKFDGEIE